MPHTTADELTKILEAGDAAACLKLFEHASEEERRAVAPTAVAFFKRTAKDMFVESPPGTFSQNPLMPAAKLALLATGSFTEIKAAGWRGIPDPERSLEVLTARQPKWTGDYAEWLISQRRHWPLVRQLVRTGLCEPPKHENYILCMISVVSGWHLDPFSEKRIGVAEYLRRNPDLMENEFWQLFQIEGEGDLTLAAGDKCIGGADKKGEKLSWSGGLLELSNSGELPRERLLDESLAAMNRGFSQFRVAWFGQFHELLEPTPAERKQRLPQYLDLLGSNIPPTVTFAFNALDAVDAKHPLETSVALAALPPVMHAKHKGTAKRGLQWLEKLAERDVDCRLAAACVAAKGLTHEAAEVQKAALEFVAKYGDRNDKELRGLVAQAKPGVAASLKKKLEEWLGGGGEAVPTAKPAAAKLKSGSETKALESLLKEAAAIDKKWRKAAGIDSVLKAWQQGNLDLTAAEFSVRDVPQLFEENRVAPVADLEELIDVCLLVIEDPDGIEQAERALDGISRLCDQRPNDFERRTGPLLKRVQKLTGRGGWQPFMSGTLRDDLLDVIPAWLIGEPPKMSKELPARQARSHDVALRAVARKPAALLSAPTHLGGWIDPLAITERMQAYEKSGETPGISDACYGLLRLAFESRAKALKQLAKCTGETADAFRHALGDDGVKTGTSEALWASAARARHLDRDDERVQKKLGDIGPDGAAAAKYAYCWKERKWKSGDYSGTSLDFELEITPVPPKTVIGIPTIEMLSETRLDRGEAENDVRWLAYVWPAGREAFYARGCRALAHNIDWWEAEWKNKHFLEPLLEPNAPIGEMGALLLSIGLCAKEPGEHLLATDIVVSALQEGRLDAAGLTPPLVMLLTTANAKAARLAKVLEMVARTSPLHLFAVRDLLEAVLTQIVGGEELPKDLPQLMELLLEVLSEAEESPSPALRKVLSAQKGSGKLGKIIKAILALPERTNDAWRRIVVAKALEERMARARKWLQ